MRSFAVPQHIQCSTPSAGSKGLTVIFFHYMNAKVGYGQYNKCDWCRTDWRSGSGPSSRAGNHGKRLLVHNTSSFFLGNQAYNNRRSSYTTLAVSACFEHSPQKPVTLSNARVQNGTAIGTFGEMIITGRVAVSAC